MDKRHEKLFHWKPYRVGNEHMKGCPTLLAIREMQVKTDAILLYIRTVILKILNNIKCWEGCESTVSLMYWWSECIMGIVILENSKFLKIVFSVLY